MAAAVRVLRRDSHLGCPAWAKVGGDPALISQQDSQIAQIIPSRSRLYVIS
jgi:hypothetical protein